MSGLQNLPLGFNRVQVPESPEDLTSPLPKNTAKSTGSAARIMAFGMFLSRLLGMLRDTAMTTCFGVGVAVAPFNLAMTVPDFVFMLIAGGGLSSAFIPVFSEFWYKGEQKKAWRAFSVITCVCSVIAVVIISIAWLAAPYIVAFVGREKPRPEMWAEATALSRIILPAQFAFLIGSILIGTLYARKQFLAPSVAPNVYNLGIIIGAIVGGSVTGLGISGAAWGALCGAGIGNLLIPILIMLRQRDHFTISFNVRTEGVSKFFKLLLPVILGFSLPSMVLLISKSFASHYGEAAINVIQYSNNLMQAPLGIIGQSLALAAFPALAQFFALKQMNAYRDEVSKTIRTTLYLSLPAAAIMFALSPQIVQLIYGYGKASQDPGQLALISDCLRIYSVGVFAWCVQPVLMRAFFSLHKTFTPIALSTLMTVLFIGECYAIQHSVLGITAMPWASNIAAVLLIIILYVALEKEVGKLDRPHIAATLLLSTAAALLTGAVAYGCSLLYQPTHKVAAFLYMLFMLCVAGWAYYFVTKAFAMPEATFVARAMDKRRGNKR